MIRGSFVGTPARRRPFVEARFHFPTIGLGGRVAVLVDTGADSTVLAPADALRLP